MDKVCLYKQPIQKIRFGRFNLRLSPSFRNVLWCFDVLSDEIIKELEIKSSEEVLVLSIITLGKDLKSSTMNLQAPLIINVKNNLAKQFIMQNSEYKTKHPLIRRD